MTAEVPSLSSPAGVRRRWPGVAFLLFALVPLACVNLAKPGGVEECAKNSTCSDDPNTLPGPEPGPDAAVLPDGTSTPDLASPDTAPDLPSDPPSDPPTVVPDGPGVPDLPNDPPPAPDAGGDSKGNDVVLIVDDGGGDSIGTKDRAFGPETPAELGPEPGPEPGPELGPETGPEAGPELGPESGREQGPELGPEPGSESGREQGPEPGPEPAPEPGRDGGDSGSGSCITKLINDGYAAGTAPPCSVCIENGTSKTDKCTKMIDCLAPPKTQADVTNCQNTVGADSVVGGCVFALTTDACPSGF
jgi:hypothetical protein